MRELNEWVSGNFEPGMVATFTGIRIKAQFVDCNSEKSESNVIVFLDDENNFEKQLISDGFSDEIKKAILTIELPQCQNTQHETAKKSEIEGFNDVKLYESLKPLKTQLGPIVADAIIKSEKPLPPKITDLFNKIQDIFNESKTIESN